VTDNLLEQRVGVGGGVAATNPHPNQKLWIRCHFDRREKSKYINRAVIILNQQIRMQRIQFFGIKPPFHGGELLEICELIFKNETP